MTAHQEITRFSAIEGKKWNHPAMSDGLLLIRNMEAMAAFDYASRLLSLAVLGRLLSVPSDLPFSVTDSALQLSR